MTGTSVRKTVAEFGTGYLTTRILSDGPGYLWIRTPGPGRAEGFTAVPPAVRRALSASAGPPAPEPITDARAVLGGKEAGPDESFGVERRYRVDSPYSLGHVLAGPQAVPHQWEALPGLLRHCGRMLREIHGSVPAPSTLATPRGAGRLAAWLDGHADRGHSARLRDEARARLGEARLRRAAQWCSPLNTPTDQDVLLLGGLTLGSVVPTRGGEGCHVLAGEELARGPAAYDLGWALGELAEFRLLHFAGGDHGPAVTGHCAEAGAALLRGYTEAAGQGPPAVDTDTVARIAVLRILTHIHDYAAFVEWTDQATHYLDLLADLIDRPVTALEAVSGGQTPHRPIHEPEDQ